MPEGRPDHGRTHARAAEPPPRRPTRPLPTPPWARGIVALLLLSILAVVLIRMLP
jgi:hypothetical protein